MHIMVRQNLSKNYLVMISCFPLRIPFISNYFDYVIVSTEYTITVAIIQIAFSVKFLTYALTAGVLSSLIKALLRIKCV